MLQKCRNSQRLTLLTSYSQPILDILAEMIAVDPSISVTSSTAGGDSANVE